MKCEVSKSTSMKCDVCKHNTLYYTGADEYPPNTSIPMCAKGWWEDTPMLEAEGDPWADCKDFTPKICDELFEEIGFSRVCGPIPDVPYDAWVSKPYAIYYDGKRFKLTTGNSSVFVGTRDEIVSIYRELTENK